jgi:hypothetical protein
MEPKLSSSFLSHVNFTPNPLAKLLTNHKVDPPLPYKTNTTSIPHVSVSFLYFLKNKTTHYSLLLLSRLFLFPPWIQAKFLTHKKILQSTTCMLETHLRFDVALFSSSNLGRTTTTLIPKHYVSQDWKLSIACLEFQKFLSFEGNRN